MRTMGRGAQRTRFPRRALLAVIALVVLLLPACANGHQFDTTPTPIPPTPTLTPTATAIPPTPTLTPTPTRTPLVIPTPQRQAAAGGTPSTSLAWQESGALHTPRGGHTATLLADGTVLVVGGFGTAGASAASDSSTLATAERYDPLTGTWRAAGTLAAGRAYHTATRLPNGQVLVVGGEDDTGYLATAELYDPTTDRWRPTGALTTPRSRHTATYLPDGGVLVLGGETSPDGTLPGEYDAYAFTATAERYIPASGTWQPAGSMLEERADHTATLLPGDEILILGGGWSEEKADPEALSAERFDPRTGRSRPAADLPMAYYSHTATALPGGDVFVVGDLSRDAYRYDPGADRWRVAGQLGTEHSGHTATLLANGLILIVGGFDQFDTTELFAPADGWTHPVTQPRTQRFGHTATILTDGSVLVAGGVSLDDEEWSASVERYRPGAEQAGTARQPGEYRANFASWLQLDRGDTLRLAAEQAGGSYHAQLAANLGYFAVPTPERTRYRNFSLEVAIDLRESASAAAGVAFRVQNASNLQESYVLYLMPEGSFGLARIGDDGAWNSLQPPIETGALRPYGVNRLQLRCEGDTIQIAINDRPVGRYHAAITDPGTIGLFVGAWAGEPLDVAFSQLRIIPLP